MKFVIFWTDYFVFLLLIMAIVLIIRIWNNAQLRKIWRNVINRPLNIVAMVILTGYVTIGILDSLHVETKDNGIISVLDEILFPLWTHTERTYSAPFALYAFTKETILQADGKIVREYPRLQFAGKQLTPEQKWPFIQHLLLQVCLQALVIWGALSAVLFWLFGRNKVKSHFPWRSFLAAIGVMVFLIIFVFTFMPHFHIFGTNEVGEDVLYQTLKSIRTGLIIGTVTTLVMLPFAVLFGIMAGYFRGWIDDVIQYTYTTLSSIPAVLLIAAAVLTLQLVMDRHTDLFQTVESRADARLLALCAILGITSWTSLCRLLRGETLKLSQIDFIQAAHSLGASHASILFKHLLPNVFHIVLITIVLDFSGLVLAEAVLSYVGVGVDPSSYSWGTMINSARLEMARDPIVWWSLTAAFIFMFVLVLAANIFSDAIRDAFDPRSALRGDQ